MNAVETLTALMDKARKITGLTEKISVARLTGLMDHFDLHVNPNLLSETTYVNNKSGTYGYIQVTRNGVLKNGKTYTFSLDAKTSDGQKHLLRYRLYDHTQPALALPKNDDGNFWSNEHAAITFTIPNNEAHAYNLMLYNSDWQTVPTWTTTFSNCKLEYGDLATPLQKVGGS